MSVNHSASDGVAVAYLRDSGHETQELSTAQQRAVISQYAAENHIPVLRWFTDDAAPGSSTIGRREFLDMIDYLRTPDCPAKTLLIWSYSRFARDIDDAQFFKADLRRRGITIQSITDPVPAGLDGRFFESAIDWMNAKYLEALAIDIKRGQRHILQTHAAIGGLPPVGFKREPIIIGQHRDGRPHTVARWVPDPDQMDRIRLAFKLRSQGASYGQIHEQTHLFRGINGYKYFFSNSLYIGIMQFADLTIPNYCAPIIDLDTWHAVQARLNTQPRRPRRDPAVLLSGIAFCARCSSPLNGYHTTAKGKRYSYYVCSSRHNRRACDAPKIPRPDLDQAVLHTLTEYILSPEVSAHRSAHRNQAQQDQQRQADERKNDLTRRIASLRRKIDNIVATIAESGHSSALLATLAELETSHTAARAELAELLSQPVPATNLADTLQPEQIQHLIETGDTQTLHTILIGFIERVTVERIGSQLAGIITYYDPPVVTIREYPRRAVHSSHNCITYTCQLLTPADTHRHN